MSWKRAKSPGWAAFDLKQQNKRSPKFGSENEPYPHISTTVSPLQLNRNLLNNNSFSVASFANVLNDIKKPFQLGDSSANSAIEAYEKLKNLHPWADKSLIEDIMEAVKNDINKASNLLKEMVSSDSVEENKELEVGSNDNKEFMHDDLSEEKMLGDHGGLMEKILSNLKFIPVEPEWEEDDIYLIHRKDAVRMMRSAARHSKAANEAYLRGEHIYANQCSLKAKEEWESAEKLNNEAANKILSIRNCKNDEWTLDLHGLHATEAVEALYKHLKKIETRAPLDRSSNPKGFNNKTCMVRSASLESGSSMEIEKLDKEPAPPRKRSTTLQVITGRGNHSKGHAAIPVAIRNFLSENRYQYDEARPGVIIVRPKFRRG